MSSGYFHVRRDRLTARDRFRDKHQKNSITGIRLRYIHLGPRTFF